MLTPDQKQAIRDEIASKQAAIAELQEAITYHEENPQPDGVFGGRDLETQVSQLRSEIGRLRERLKS